MRSTKKTLVLSVLSLALCCAMLIGTTYAWFTDEAKAAVNTIQSGKLDVELVGENDADLTGKTLTFVNADGETDILWEPGCTYDLEPVYIKNAGNLALKYKVAVTGIDGDAKLLEAIDFTTSLDGDEITEGYLLPEETSGQLVISGHMREDAGNEYMDLKLEEVAITVYAAQYTNEVDKFDDQYDANAAYGTAPTAKVEKTVVDGTDVAYKFSATETATEVLDSEYKDWNADFVVTFDKAVDDIELGGCYEAYNDGAWVSDTIAVGANTEIRLLQELGFVANYKDMCTLVKEFTCGAADKGDNAGAKMTVQLRLYEVIDGTETGEFIIINSYSYTF